MTATINPANLSASAKFYYDQITVKGKLRSSKPKNGPAAYVWRNVAFSLSSDPRMQCMPVTADFGISNDTIPEYWLPEAPEDYLTEQVQRVQKNQSDIDFCLSRAGSIEEYFRTVWVKYERRNTWIKLTLDPVIKELVDTVPVKDQPGTMRWYRVFH